MKVHAAEMRAGCWDIPPYLLYLRCFLVRIRPRVCHLASFSHRMANKTVLILFCFCFCLKTVNPSAWKMSNLLYLGEMRIGSIEYCCLRTRGTYAPDQASEKSLLGWFLFMIRSHTLTQATEVWERTQERKPKSFSMGLEKDTTPRSSHRHIGIYSFTKAGHIIHAQEGPSLWRHKVPSPRSTWFKIRGNKSL